MKMSNQLSILKNSRPETLVFILERESSYVAAVILSCLDKNAATQVLELLNPKFVDEIFQCMNAPNYLIIFKQCFKSTIFLIICT